MKVMAQHDLHRYNTVLLQRNTRSRCASPTRCLYVAKFQLKSVVSDRRVLLFSLCLVRLSDLIVCMLRW